MNKVLAIFAGGKRELGGCEIYRITMPFHYLERNGHWMADWAFFEDIYAESRIYGPSYWRAFIDTYDLFVFPRFYVKPEAESQLQEIFEVFRLMGKPVIYEVDDDFTNKHRVVVDGDAMEVARHCNAISVTTPYLAETMRQETGRDTYVLPNCIDPGLWHKLPENTWKYSDRVVIGLTGSKSHSEDWRVLETVLPEIVKNEKAHLVVMGYQPEYLEGLPNTTYLPGMTYDKYAQVIQRCDIILTPVNNDGFNMGKSPLKAIEGMSARRKIGYTNAGAAIISSDHPVYHLAVKHGKTGLITPHTPQAWTDYITLLIEDDSLRHELQINGHEWVNKHHDISKKWALWQNAYDAVLRKHTPRSTSSVKG